LQISAHFCPIFLHIFLIYLAYTPQIDAPTTLTTPLSSKLLQRQYEENPHFSPNNQHFSRENSFNITKTL